jgi:hypothetical protein
MDWQKTLTGIFSGLLALILVGGLTFQALAQGHVDPELAALAGAAVATYLTGGAIRQVNGAQVATLTTAVLGIHSRLDAAGIGAAKDGSAPPPEAPGGIV